MNTLHTVRTRFAPSPTGYLHVGGARTAIFNYLFARHAQGEFLLRIEDTDKERSDDKMTTAILNSMEWLRLSWDGTPLYQSGRGNRHAEVCEQLYRMHQAYPCFCTPENLAIKRQEAQNKGEDTRYDRTCLGLSEEKIAENIKHGMPFTLRFHVPEGSTTFQDLVHGPVHVDHKEIDDFIIRRSDGTPVYQIAVVVDDHDMGITHVIRGDDHLSNTPKQILLYQALGWQLPQFGHVPLILGSDKKRLSKRHGATAIESYREQGILPEALVNFLILLGWSPGDDREIMPLETLVQEFSLERISRKPAVFDPQKLEWMNATYIAKTSNDALLRMLSPEILKNGWLSDPMTPAEKEMLHQILDLLKPRMKSLNDFTGQAAYFFEDPGVYNEKAVRKHWTAPEVSQRLEQIRKRLQQCKQWREASLESLIRQTAEEMGVGAGKLIHPIRLAITGRESSPGLFEVMVLLGRACVIRRIEAAIARLAGQI